MIINVNTYNIIALVIMIKNIYLNLYNKNDQAAPAQKQAYRRLTGGLQYL